MQQFKAIMQQDEMDCGVACVKMILNHYGSEVPIHKLRTISGTDREGASALGLKKSLNEFNLDCDGIQANDRVWKNAELTYPVIAHVIIDEKHLHYVVVYGESEGQLQIADPAKGKYEMAIEDFNHIWSGVLLITEPSKNYTPQVEKVAGLKAFVPILLNNKGALFKILFIILFMTILSIMSTFYFQILIDKIIPGNNMNWLNILSMSLIIVYILNAVMDFVKNIMLAKFGYKLSSKIILDYIDHIFNLPMDFFSSRQTGEIISRFIDANKIIDALTNASVTILIDLLLLIVIGITLFYQSSELFLLTTLSIPLYVLTIHKFIAKYVKANDEEMSVNAILNSNIIESLKGVETIKATNSQLKTFSVIKTSLEKAIEKSYIRVRLDSQQSVIKSLIQLITNVITIWYGSFLVINQSLTLGQLITYNTLLSYFITPLLNIINLQPKIQSAQIASTRINEVLSIEKEINGDGTNDKFDEYKIKMSGVNFSYNYKKNILKNVNLEIPTNQKTAILGASGSGKSSLAKLFVNFYKPNAGNIYINEKPIQNLNNEELRNLITYVPQESFFFKGTIYENLTYGLNRIVTDDEIIEACRLACIEDLIESHPMGLKLIISESASNLSGGQKQRLAVARSLLRDSSIIIFDEITSGMDIILEKQLINNLSAIKNKTIIFLTHSLPIATLCNQIILLKNGEIATSGNHHMLLGQDEMYKKIWSYVTT